MKKKIAVLLSVFSVVFISCDQDFNTIGADLVGDEHFDFDAYTVQNIKAYSVSTEEVQTSNLPINPLGFYNNPYFGETKANFVTQAALTAVQPDFGTDIKVENVTLYVPYFSTLISTNSNNESTYKLDSIYGANKESKMKLSVYENGYFLNTLDPSPTSNFQDEQRYYNNSTSNSGTIDFEGLKIGHDGSTGNIGPERLNDNLDPSENDQFYFNKEEVVIYQTKYNTTSGVLEYIDVNGAVISPQTDVAQRVVKARLAPGMYLTLNREFFKKRILEASSANLYSNNDFKQYFKGLYFKMEQIAGEEGAMAMLNFSNAILNINFNSKNTGTAVVSSKTFSMKIGANGGNTVSLQDFTPKSDYTNGLLPVNQNQTTGQNDKLFVKGGKGSLVYMDLFGGDLLNADLVAGPNGVPDELDEIRKKGWLINDAYLEVYVDKTAMSANSKEQEPERLYLFDATNQKPLVDYSFDSSVSSNTKRSKVIFGGIVERDANGKAVKYKIRITQHINNLLNSPNFNLNKNVKLGLCVIENIGLVSNYYYKVPKSFVIGPDIKIFPVSSITAQQGVVLYGTNPAGLSPEDTEKKKLKLTIHYTKPN